MHLLIWLGRKWLSILRPLPCCLRLWKRPGTRFFSREASASDRVCPCYARGGVRRIIDMAQRGTKDQNELVEPPFAFLRQTIDLSDVGKFLRQRPSSRQRFPRLRPQAARRCRNGLLHNRLLEVSHR
jgi:hypothetical protein